ncbi:olfactory receptor 52L1-like [Hoplias malabaricus]|uniref:olfactory receptor 52L1-like n=1 Tax=Hoplias malabaricus TaxID=27720 RepID=UPI003461D1C9
MDYFNNGSYLSLEGHVELETYRYFYFIITLIIYGLIICFNSVVIFVIFTNKCLHEPMYIFITALLFNALFGATALYPRLLSDLLSKKQVVYYQVCLFQAFCIYTYAVSEFTLLSVMAYDRYVSICKPLQYSTLIKMSTVQKLIFLSWFLPSFELGVGAILTSQLHLCEYILNRIYCDNFSIVKLSCGNTSVNNLYGLFILIIAIFPPVIFIIFSYIQILAVCLRNSKDFRRKALQTCFPHLFIFIIFSVNACFEVINTRLESHIPHIVSVVMSVEYLIVPPLFNPIIYGLKMQEILKRIKMLIFQRKRKVFIFRS